MTGKERVCPAPPAEPGHGRIAILRLFSCILEGSLNIRFRQTGRKNRRLARCPHLDRPFHRLQNIAGTAGRGPRRFGRRCGQSLAPPRISGQRRPGASCRLRRKIRHGRILILFPLPGIWRPVSGEWAGKSGGWPVSPTWTARAPRCAENAPERPFRSDSGRAPAPPPPEDSSAKRFRTAKVILPPLQRGKSRSAAEGMGVFRPAGGVALRRRAARYGYRRRCTPTWPPPLKRIPLRKAARELLANDFRHWRRV